MGKLINFLQKNIFNSFIIFLLILNILPIVAPIAAHYHLHFISKPIYSIFFFTCHQFHWRSLHLFDYQFAWCTRDTFIWLAFLLTTLAVKFKLIKTGLSWYWIVPFMIPIAMDGGIQTIATIIGLRSNEQFYLATNFSRMITGSIFGIGLGIIIAPFLYEEQQLYQQDYAEISNAETSFSKQNYFVLLIKLAVIWICLFLIYLIFIQLWKITSPNYPPVEYTDQIVRNAPETKNWVFSRTRHGDT